jgi:branched-chain amino acid transport system permease protein
VSLLAAVPLRPALRRVNTPFTLAVLALLGVPWLTSGPLPSYYLGLITEALIMGIFGLGFNLLLGYAGKISFGHAAYFGLGAYVTGLLMLRLAMPYLPAVAIALVAVAIVAAFVGFFSIRLAWVYFALLTFAFAQIFYELSTTWTDVTGGFDGVPLSMPMQLSILGLVEVNLRDRVIFYFVVVGLTIMAYLIARMIVRSPFGQALVAIRENEVRASVLGYNVARYTQVVFVISAVFAAVAGALFVPYQRYVSPDLLAWHLSGLVIIMVLLGGLGTLWGPIVGAGAVLFLRDWISGFTNHYYLVIGLIFVLIVLFAPDGLGGLPRLRGRLRASLDDVRERRISGQPHDTGFLEIGGSVAGVRPPEDAHG